MVRIEIKKTGQKVVIVTFDTRSDQFDSSYERNKFFRELHGWKQTVPHGEKRYSYHREGLLDGIPHMKISGSVFAVAHEHMRQVEAFFDQWQRKVEYDMIQVMMARQRFLKNLSRGVSEEDQDAE
ncbi:MAG: hypothetical protein ABIA21_00185 [Candidatus Aenigmatarchaeota archaeon]